MTRTEIDFWFLSFPCSLILISPPNPIPPHIISLFLNLNIFFRYIIVCRIKSWPKLLCNTFLSTKLYFKNYLVYYPWTDKLIFYETAGSLSLDDLFYLFIYLVISFLFFSKCYLSYIFIPFFIYYIGIDSRRSRIQLVLLHSWAIVIGRSCLHMCLWTQLANFSLKFIYSYRYQFILFILHKDYSLRVPHLTCALVGDLATFGDLAIFFQFWIKMVFYIMKSWRHNRSIELAARYMRTCCASACWLIAALKLTCTPPFVNNIQVLRQFATLKSLTQLTNCGVLQTG